MLKKVIIPAAGRGTRMKELGKDKPKHLIEVNGKPFLYHLLTNLKKANWQEFIIVCGHQSHQIEKFAQQYKKEFNIKLVNQFEILGEEKYGTACAVEAVENIIDKEENFVVLYGDNLYSPDDLKIVNIDDEYNYVVGMKKDDWQNYGVLIYKKDKLIKIDEKPKKFVGDIINTGLYKFTPKIFDAIKKIKKSSRGEYELTDAINLLAKKDDVKVKIINNYWLDFGKPEDIDVVGKHLSNNIN